jgi:hypothetical protein
MVELQASTSLQIEGCRDDEGFGDRIYTYIVVTHLKKTIDSINFKKKKKKKKKIIHVPCCTLR